MSDNKITDWFDEVPSVPDPWQEAKPRLTQKEIKKIFFIILKIYLDGMNYCLLLKRKLSKYDK